MRKQVSDWQLHLARVSQVIGGRPGLELRPAGLVTGLCGTGVPYCCSRFSSQVDEGDCDCHLGLPSLASPVTLRGC